MAKSPIDEREEQERALATILATLWSRQTRVHSQEWARAVRASSPGPVVQSERWVLALEDATVDASVAYRDMLFFAALGALHKSVSEREVLAGALANEHAPRRAAQLARAVDGETRRGLGRALRDAFRRVREGGLLRDAVNRVRRLLGLTEKQVRRAIVAEERDREFGMPERAVERTATERSRAARERNARVIADRETAEGVNFARGEVWGDARDHGSLPPAGRGLMKAWQDVGDDRVRPHHHAQTLMGPIPFDVPYPIFGVMRPPAPEFGCRCWDKLVLPDGVRMKDSGLPDSLKQAAEYNENEFRRRIREKMRANRMAGR